MAETNDHTRGFFIMYGESIKTLQDELVSVLGNALARGFLFRFGFKTGHVTAREIWLEMGLARPTTIKKQKNGLTITLEETLESSYAGDKGCDFTRGFVGGLITGITNVPHYCIEKECVSNGAKDCVFIVTEEEKK
jgi:hypothetical protein